MPFHNRRDFLKTSFAGVTASASLVGSVACSPKKPSLEYRKLKAASPKVIIVKLKKKLKYQQQAEEKLGNALQVGLELLTEKKKAAAWTVFFTETDRIGIKVNSLAGKKMSTNPLLSLAFAKKIIRNVKLPAHNIIIWDRESEELKRAGFDIKIGKNIIQCFGTNENGVGYENKLSINGEVCGMLSRILTYFTNVTVNMPILKDHNLAGISGGMKNMYGSIHNPNKYHDNNCDPFVAQLNSIPVLKNRLRLIVVDALKIQFQGGPGYQPQFAFDENSIVLGIDPVAVDRVLLKMLDDIRLKHGLKRLEQTDHPAQHILTAGKTPYKLGVAELNKINQIYVEV